LRAAFDYLADHPGREVSSLDLTRAFYPHDSDGAEQRLYGVLGAFGRRKGTARSSGSSLLIGSAALTDRSRWVTSAT
jgi:hypothetical protein